MYRHIIRIARKKKLFSIHYGPRRTYKHYMKATKQAGPSVLTPFYCITFRSIDEDHCMYLFALIWVNELTRVLVWVCVFVSEIYPQQFFDRRIFAFCVSFNFPPGWFISVHIFGWGRHFLRARKHTRAARSTHHIYQIYYSYYFPLFLFSALLKLFCEFSSRHFLSDFYSRFITH